MRPGYPPTSAETTKLSLLCCRNGHWHFTKTINGVRYRCALPTARTKAQAEEAEREELRKIHEGRFGKPTGSTVFIDFAEGVYLPWSRVALNTGMRRGEILSLKWSQVDLQRNIIHLIRTKSGKQRDVPINSVARDELLTLQSQSESEFVFANPRTGLALMNCKRAFIKACELAGVEDFHFHDARHTAATRMAATGAEPSTIKDILGHSEIRMMDRYTHAVELRKRAALERIAEYGKSARVIDIEERRTG